MKQVRKTQTRQSSTWRRSLCAGIARRRLSSPSAAQGRRRSNRTRRRRGGGARNCGAAATRGRRRDHRGGLRQRHDPGDPFPARGPEDVKRIVTMLRSMLSDFHIEVEAMIAEGDFVVSRYTATATDNRRLHGACRRPERRSARRRSRSSASRTARSSRAGRHATTSGRCISSATSLHLTLSGRARARRPRHRGIACYRSRSRTSRRAAPAAAESPAS